jgi:hypothetical protein
MMQLSEFTVRDLLRLQADVLDELRSRNIVRSSNAPAGDYAELLFAKAYGWTLEGKSSAGHDATDTYGVRYQIKCRRLTKHNASRQLSAIRNLGSRPFDVLAAVLLGADFRVSRAALVPIEVVQDQSTFISHVNAHRFLLRDAVWRLPGVVDVTAQLQSAETTI